MFRSFLPRRAALASPIGAIFGLASLAPPPLLAQLVPDATLPTPSIVTDTVDGQRITGGTQAGSNLFHSFESFAIPEGMRAEFSADGGISNVLTRVTGDGIATIEGTLAATGSANVYLLVPGGILFGENSSLDVGGNFSATTASTIAFEDGLSYGMAPIADRSLLSIGVPLGLGLDPTASGNIVNRSQTIDATGNIVGLRVNDGSTIELVGRNIQFDGGYTTNSDGTMTLAALETVAVTDGGRIELSGDTGGTLSVQAQTLRAIDGSKILADALRTIGGTDLENEATAAIAIDVDLLEVRNDAVISTSTFGPGCGGTIDVNARLVEFSGTASLDTVLPVLFSIGVVNNPDQIGSGLFAMSFGEGDSGTLNVNATDVTLDNGAFIVTTTTGAGNGGVLNVAADRILLRDSQIVAETFGAGSGGIVNLNANFVRLEQGGGIFGSHFDSGVGGTVNIVADRIEIDGTTPEGTFNSGIGVNSFTQVESVGGTVTVEAREIALTNGGVITASTFGPARSGTIIVRASESLDVDGVSDDGQSLSSITTQSRSTGEAGDIEVAAGRLSVTGGASIFTSALDVGPAGRLTVRATESILVSGRSPDGTQPSSLRADADVAAAPSALFPPSVANIVGAAGDMTVITPELDIRDGASLIVSSTGTGEQAGNLSIEADRVRLDTGATIVAETAAATEGNLSIQADTVQLRNGAGISTNATGEATGGNIEIASRTLVGLDNSDITANAEAGSGGQVCIDTTGVFGLEFRTAPTSESDITATSDLGVQFSGVVALNSPEIKLDNALVELPESFAGLDRVKADRCRARGTDNRFVISGPAGMPTTPDGDRTLSIPPLTPQSTPQK